MESHRNIVFVLLAQHTQRRLFRIQHVRYSGLSIGYHFSAALFSGPATFLAAALVAWTHSTLAISTAISCATLVLLAAIAGLKETGNLSIADAPERSDWMEDSGDAGELAGGRRHYQVSMDVK